MVNFLLLLTHLPALGDFSLEARLDRTRLAPGETLVVTAWVRGDAALATAKLPEPNFAAQPDPSIWTVGESRTKRSPGRLEKTWHLTARQSGTWRLPDIACSFTREDIPFTSNSQSLRLVGLDPVEITSGSTREPDLLAERIQAGALAELPHHLRGLIALARLAWVGPCLVTLILVVAKWIRFPADPDARRAWWRAWLVTRGLPPGRHTREGLGSFLRERGWKPDAVDRILNAWDQPLEGSPLPHPEARALAGWTLAGMFGLVFAALTVARYLPLESKADQERLRSADAAWVHLGQSAGTQPEAVSDATAIYRELAPASPVGGSIRLQWIDEGKDPSAIPRTVWGPLVAGFAWCLLWSIFLTWGQWFLALVLVIGLVVYPSTRPGGHNLFLTSATKAGDAR